MVWLKNILLFWIIFKGEPCSPVHHAEVAQHLEQEFSNLFIMNLKTKNTDCFIWCLKGNGRESSDFRIQFKFTNVEKLKYNNEKIHDDILSSVLKNSFEFAAWSFSPRSLDRCQQLRVFKASPPRSKCSIFTMSRKLLFDLGYPGRRRHGHSSFFCHMLFRVSLRLPQRRSMCAIHPSIVI